MISYRVRVDRGKNGDAHPNVQLLVYDAGRLIDTYHFVSWLELIRWGVI